MYNAVDNSPFPDASVFLSNTTIGARSNADGSFFINDVKPGKYTLVVSAVGFESHTEEIMLDRNFSLRDVKLLPKSTVLQDVTIKFDAAREKRLKLFTQELLGWSENAKETKILNPEVVSLKIDKDSVLTASADDYIQIENKALGYNIKYLLKVFSLQLKTGLVSYTGEYKFEKMQGTSSEDHRWEKHRKEAYLGSPKHFFRSLIANTYKKDGFTVYKVVREHKPLFVDTNFVKSLIVNDSLIRVKDDTNSYRVVVKKDTVKYNKKNPPMEKLRIIDPQLTAKEIFSPTDQPGIYALRFDDLLKNIMFVIYTKKLTMNSAYEFVNRRRFLIDRPTTFVAFTKPYALFDSNGIITSAGSIAYSGDWSVTRVADLLPVDYWPNE
ncbi:hypothetical protein GCM10023149_43680 [Mucilaginibacter gynuensis]|uniref:Carboxypeptidase-like regulatory domain-containing protein n=1 Tax=Mucilaginibacter gynuensis TaxID=1302236 RepID=A0ABP8H884_9SPHI